MSLLLVLELDGHNYVSSYHILTFWESDSTTSFTIILNYVLNARSVLVLKMA